MERDYKIVSVPAECVLAMYLFDHPGRKINHSNGREYVYDSEKECFMSRKLTNKIMNGWYRARGMDAWLARATKYFRD